VIQGAPNRGSASAAVDSALGPAAEVIYGACWR
jgi:hypothetical protein